MDSDQMDYSGVGLVMGDLLPVFIDITANDVLRRHPRATRRHMTERDLFIIVQECFLDGAHVALGMARAGFTERTPA